MHISTRIKLFFDVSKDLVLEKKIPRRGTVIRLYCSICFETPTGWSIPYPGIIDTGAHTTIIPERIWKTSRINIITKHFVKGIVPKKECKLEVKIGEITGLLIDRKNQSRKIKFLAYFAPTDDVPLIIGFKELLEKFRIYFDYKKKEGFIEE